MGCVNPQEQKIMFAFELSDLLTGRKTVENPQSFRSLLGSAHYQLQSNLLDAEVRSGMVCVRIFTADLKLDDTL